MKPVQRNIQFNWSVLQPGDILEEVSYKSPFSRLLCKVLDCDFSHDAGIVYDGYRVWIGESRGLHSRLTDPRDWERKMSNGEIRVRVLRKTGITRYQGEADSSWWIANVLPRGYDWFAYPMFTIKALYKLALQVVGKHLDDLPEWANEDGVRWMFYCSEGWREAGVHGSGLDPWGRNNPTPKTTHNRELSGGFQAIPGLLIDGVEACDTYGGLRE